MPVGEYRGPFLGSWCVRFSRTWKVGSSDEHVRHGASRPGLAEASARVTGLRGRTVAVIGGTNGVGRAIVNEAVSKGAEVWVVGRTFRDRPDPRVHFVEAGL